MINAISPIDGRYADKTKELTPFFSEYALIKYRIYIEIHYLLKLSNQITLLLKLRKVKVSRLLLGLLMS